MTMRAAYSMCKTRLGVSISDFEEACTIGGRIATTPPAATRQSTAAIRDVSRSIASSVRTPIECVPGSTRSGPFLSLDSSR